MANRPSFLDELNPSRAAVLRLLKRERYASIGRVAEELGVTHEAARKQIADLQRRGWIESDCATDDDAEGPATMGRPAAKYCLTAAGDHFFPKQYADLAMALLDSSDLAQLTDANVARLRHKAEDAMDVLRSIYRDGDPYMSVEDRGETFVLIERNCPYLDVAMERPVLCSTTVSALRRLTGCEVVRERRFQDGDARCEFHVHTRTASPELRERRFEIEPPRTN